MGFRWNRATSKDGSPFDCERCTEDDRKNRNCSNWIALGEPAKAVTTYTSEVKAELKEKGAAKVWSAGDIRLYECPLSYLTRDTIDMMRMVYLIDCTGRLLHGGGWGEQPHWLVEAFEIFKAENSRRIEDGRDG